MPTQKQIGEHLDLSQAEVSKLMGELGVDWKTAALDQIRVAYIRRLRSAAAGHKSGDMDLVGERVKTERVDRELKEITLAEKRGQVVNLAQLEPALTQMVVAFRTDVLTLPDKLKSDLDALYGIDIDLQLLTDPIHATLDQLARYDPERAGTGASAGRPDGAAGADDDDSLGQATTPAQPEEHSPAGALQP